MSTARRFELVEGSSNKFWEIRREGTSVVTRYGRIGTDGQSTTKQAASVEAATKLYESLVNEKTRKGYVEKTSARSAAKARPAAKGKKSELDAICDDIESYFDKLATLDGLEFMSNHVLKPSTPAAIDAFEKKSKITLPADIRAFLTRGLRTKHYALDGAWIGFDFLDLTLIQKVEKTMRAVAKSVFPDDEEIDEDDDELLDQANILRRGIPLTGSEPQLVWHEGALYHFSVRNPVRPVCRSFTDFLGAWLASGGIASTSSFETVWSALKPVIGKKPKKNIWVDYYLKMHPRSR